MVPTCQSNSSNLNTQKAFLKTPGFTIVYVLGGGTEERTLMNSQTQSSAFDGGQIWGQMGGAND